MSARHEPWLPFARDDSGVRLRLFCFPYAGGSAQAYAAWRGRLPEGVQVVPLQPPGRAGRLRELPLADVDAIGAAAAEAAAALIDRPWAVFGHSLGAKSAFVFTRLVAGRYGVPPRRLFASASRAPHTPHRGAFTHDAPHDAFVAELARLGGTPPEILGDPDLMDLLLPTLRADFAASQTWMDQGADRLTCPITVLAGRADDIPEADLLAWRDRSGGGFAMHEFRGGHFFLQTEQAAVLSTVGSTLAEDMHP